ncbi:MAG: hypothetical protein GF417_04550 [Candidatus Latescibacteria bacterium]|nr:hypothetical protein [bacterium]MBD3423693.1 hypothetical protein [Candidatus Latescibacterota bacterium]
MKKMKSKREGLERKFRNDRIRIDTRMNEILPGQDVEPEILHEAMRYSSLDGGKRIRGLLCLWTHHICGNRYQEAALNASSALEFLHAYTLIHDDLPSMDDDDIRRGKSSCHIKYSPAIAILAGDALQALAFETLASIKSVPAEYLLGAIRTMANSGGSRHLVGGQAADIRLEGTEPSAEKVEFIHLNKTAELIAASMEIGAIISEGNTEKSKRLRKAGIMAGLAFQIVDDLLDLEGNQNIVGKQLRKDSARGKITYPSVYGPEKSREKAESLISEASRLVGDNGPAGLIDYIFDLIINRIH